MAERSHFTYIRQKVLVTFMRSPIPFVAPLVLRPDRLLGQSSYNATIQTIYIPSRDKKHTIKAHLYAPPSSSATSSSPVPVVVNWHGSGFILPLLGTDTLYCARLAKEIGAYVIDADYRKGPEYPFPAAVEDVEDTLDWVSTQPEHFDTSRVAVSGFSAGGNLALVASSVLRKAAKVSIKAVAAIYPVTDLTIAPEAKKVPRPVKPLSPSTMNLFTDCYTPDPVTRKDPRVSPSLGKLEEFPETVVIVTCDGDILAPEADELARKLDMEGKKVVHCRLDGVHHGFDKGVKEGTNEWKRREEGYEVIVKALKESL